MSQREPLQGQCGTTHELWAEAVKKVRSLGENDREEQQVMGQVVVQFGQHAGETSLWLVENCLGCAAYLVNSMKVEKLKSVMPHLVDTSLCLNDTSCHFLRSRRH